jgi:hypothetical protein
MRVRQARHEVVMAKASGGPLARIQHLPQWLWVGEPVIVADQLFVALFA